jgi:glutathione S-transferase
MVTIADLIGCDLSAYPNVQCWLANMRKLKNWDKVNELFSGFAAGNKGKEFVRLP